MKKINKILLIIVSVLFILGIAGYFYANSLIEKVIRREVNAIKLEQKDNYHIEVGEINVRLFLQRFTLRDVKISTHENHITEKDRSFTLDLKKLIVKVSGFKSVLTEKKLLVRVIELDRPRIDLVLPTNKDSLEIKEKSKFKSKRLSSIIVGNFAINKGDFYLHKNTNDGIQLITSVSKLDFKLEDIIVNLQKEHFKDIFSFGDLHLNLGKVEYHDAKKHEISATNVHFTNLKSGIKLGKILFRNKESIDDFSSHAKNKGTWTNGELTDVFLNIDIKQLKENRVTIHDLEVAKLDLELFQIQPATKGKGVKYSEILAKINIPIIVDTFKIKDAKVNLSIKKVNTDEIDDFQIKNAALELYHFSNDSIYLLNHPHFIGSLQSKMWTNTQLKSSFSLDPADIENSLSLQIENIPQRKIKKYIKDYELGIFKSGQIKQIEFNFVSDSNQFKGDARLSIQDLDFTYSKFPKNGSLKKVKTRVKDILLSVHFNKEKDRILAFSIDTIDVKSPQISVFEVEKNSAIRSKRKNIQALIKVGLLKISDAKLFYEKEGNEQITANINNTSIVNRNMLIDLANTGKDQIINIGDYSIVMNGISLSKMPSSFLEIKSLQIDKKKDNLTLIGLRYKNNASKSSFHQSLDKENNYISAYLEKVMIDIDLHRNIFEPIQCDKITFVHPILTFIKGSGKEKAIKKEAEKSNKPFPLNIDKIELLNADIAFLANTETIKESKILELKKLNASIKNFSTEKNRKLNATIESSLNEKSRLKMDIELDQGVKNAPLKINGSIEDISLLSLKKRFSDFIDLKFKNGDLEELNFTIQASKTSVKGDVSLKTIDLDHLILGKNKNPDWIYVDVAQIDFSFSKKKNNALYIKNFTIDDPLIEIHHYDFKEKENKISDEKKELFAKKKGKASIVHIENFNINDGVIHQFNGEGKILPLTSIEHINLNGKNIDLYDSTNSKVPLSINGLDLKMKNIIVHSIPKHDMSIGSLELNMQKKKLIIKDLDFRNKNTPEVFFSQLNYRKAWMDLSVSKIELDISLREVFSAHPRIPKAIISHATFTTHVNLALEVGPKEKPFPNRALLNSKFPFSIDSIFVDNGQLDVLFRDNKKHGILQFNDIEAKVSNLSSDPKTIKSNNQMVWIMDATLWKSGDTHIEVNYFLDKEDDDFSMIGTVKGLKMADADTLTKELYGIRVSQGIAHKIYLDISGDKHEARGIVQFDYEELRVNLEKKKKNIKNPEELKKVKKKDKLNESFVKNIIVNGLIRKRNMPDKGNYREIGDAYYKREKNKPIFNLMWFTISSGMLNIAEGSMAKGIQNLMSKDKKEKVVD